MTSKQKSVDSIQEMEGQMDALLVKSKNPSSLLPDELSYLVSAFVPSQPPPSRSKAYLVLSAFCQGVRSSKPPEKSQVGADEPDPGTLALSHVFQPLIASNLSETQEDALLAGVTFHCALFQVDWQSASEIFKDDGFIELLTTLETSTSLVVSLALTRLYAQASSHKACRSLFSDESIAWLRKKSFQTTDDTLRVVAIVALVKLAHGSAGDAAAVGGTSASNGLAREDVDRAVQLRDMIMNSKDIQTCLSEVAEGLAYLSVNSSVKKELANTKLLKRLFSFIPKRKAVADVTNNSTLIYGVLVLISNLCAYKPRLSQEEQQIAKLRQMAESGKKAGNQGEVQLDPLESEREVQTRCRITISSGALDVLAAASGLDSQGARTAVGQILLSLGENKDNRGEILKGGGSRTLIRIIQSFASSSPESLPQEALVAIQALAKLAITASPIQVFGPNEGNTLDAIRPLSQLLLHPSANMLQQFEAVMALTNLASHSENCASRIAATPHVLNKVELLMLEDHTLMRRAATELICNLVAGSENVFERYAGGKGESSTTRDQSSRSKIHVLIAMSDVEDLSTRLAASGALAMLTSTPAACAAILDLQTERHRALLVLAQLIDPSVLARDDDDDFDEEGSVANLSDLGLVHRGVVCISNLLSNLQSSSHCDTLKKEVKNAGLLTVFEKLLKGELGSYKDEVLRRAADVKKILVELST